MTVATPTDLRTRVNRLLTHGLAQIPFPEASPLAEAALRGFDRFLDEFPRRDDDTDPWTIYYDGYIESRDPDEKPDEGYLPKRSKNQRPILGGQYDDKDIFHWSRRLPELLEAHGVDSNDHHRFLSDCARLEDAAHARMVEVYRELDELIPGHSFQQGFLACDEQKLRLIRYFPGTTKDPIIGKGHHDRNCATLHLHESRPGLLVGSDERPVVLPEGEAFLFTGPRLERRTEGRLRGMWHAIRDERPLEPPRYCVVYFTHVRFKTAT